MNRNFLRIVVPLGSPIATHLHDAAQDGKPVDVFGFAYYVAGVVNNDAEECVQQTYDLMKRT
jgi:hypothetical protein